MTNLKSSRWKLLLYMFPVLLLIGSFAAAEIYKRYTLPLSRKKWENFARMHHGEAGTILTASGIVIRSPSLAATGIGLMLHDRKDVDK
jgi:hypothetical protein